MLLFDIKMPKLDGIEVYDRIEKEDVKVKVCFFSAAEYLTSNYKEMFQNSLDFMSKPISIVEMNRRIKEFLSRS